MQEKGDFPPKFQFPSGTSSDKRSAHPVEKNSSVSRKINATKIAWNYVFCILFWHSTGSLARKMIKSAAACDDLRKFAYITHQIQKNGSSNNVCRIFNIRWMENFIKILTSWRKSFVLCTHKSEKIRRPVENSAPPHGGGDLTNIWNPAIRNSSIPRKILFARLYYLYALTGNMIFRTVLGVAFRFFVFFSWKRKFFRFFRSL